MRKSGFSLLSLVAGMCLLPAAAFAQDAPAPAPAPVPAPATPTPAATASEPDHAPPPGVAPVPDSAAAPVVPAAPPPEAPAPAEAAPAAPAYPATTINGGIEGTYNRMLSAPHNADTAAPTRAYDSSNGFLLNQASIGVKHQLNEHVYGQIRFDAGANAGINSFGTSKLFDVREAYAVATGMGLTFTAGKFTTYQGIEVVDGWLNPTITRGYLYYLAEPVTHTGAKLHYTTGAFDVGVGVVNGWDTNNGYFATGDNNPMKTLIWRLGYTSAPFWAGFSGTYGVEKAGDSDPRLSLDLTGAVILGQMLTLNFQGNYGTEKNTHISKAGEAGKWAGFGLQPVFKMDAFQVGLRFEYFSDDGLSRTAYFANPLDDMGVPSNTNDKVGLWTLGIAPGYTIAGAFLLRGEFRVDGADKEVLWNGKKTQTSLAFGAAYMF